MNRPIELSPLASSIAAVAALVLAAGAARAQDTAAEPNQDLEQIVVTAQKREQALVDIPMSVTVLSGNALEQQHADNFQDLVALVPGLSLNSATRGVTRVTLRGINTGGVASTVGVYVGDVPFGSSSGLANAAILSGDFDTFDLSRIEVLRGPQGTLYGASSLGGVLKYVPEPASTDAVEARFQGSVESVDNADPGYALTGAVNVPLSDVFAVRATGFYRSDEGYIDSIGNNPIPTLTDPNVNVLEGTLVAEGLNSVESAGGRLQALFRPSDDFSVNLMALMQDIDTGAPSTVDADPDTLEPVDGLVQSRYQEQSFDIGYRLYSGTVDWDFGPAALQSITGYSTFEEDFQVDSAIAAGLTGGPPLSSLLTFLFDDPSTPEIAPLISAILPQVTSTDKWTQEFRLVSADSDTFEWLIGAYYTDEESLIDQTILAVEPGTQNPVQGLPVLAIARIESTYEEIAFFANGTWHVTDRLELSAGARQSDNEQTALQVTEGPLAGSSEIPGSSSESPFTWSFSPRFEFDDRTSAYVRVATGFRPGGPNIVPPGAPSEVASYDSDELTSYEAGLKTESAGGLFALDVAAYFLDWEDIQLFANIEGFGVNANGGTAESRGFEFTASVMPADGLTLSLNGAYTDAQLTEDTSAEVGGLDGDPLPFVPEWSFGVSAGYEWALGADSMAYVGGTAGYTGERPIGFDERQADGSIDEADSYTTLDLRAGLEYERWNFEVYGKNLSDEEGITSVGTANTIATGRVELGLIRPRTFGLSASFEF